MAEKILYYFGAGASAQALPLARSVLDDNKKAVISGLADELRNIDLRQALKDTLHHYSDFIKKTKGRFLSLADKANEFGDVDTYAKYLYLMRSDDFDHVKKSISEYFSIKQLLSKAIDNRYLPWLVGIMNKKKFPDNIKIISWNYDYQIELASNHFGSLENVSHTLSGFTHSPGFLTSYPNLDPTFRDFGELSLIHMNGIAGYAQPDGLNTGSIFQNVTPDDIQKLISFFSENKPYVHFAWENSEYHQSLMKHVNGMIKGTTIMVVIGYSFPFFNREYDKQIFQQLQGERTLKKIYYQDQVLNGQQLKSQFDLRDNFDIVHIPNTTNFHIPFEY